MQATTANLRPGGIGRSPLVNPSRVLLVRGADLIDQCHGEFLFTPEFQDLP